MIQPPLFLGIDGGGTKCKARIEDAQGNLLGEGLAGSANPVRGIESSTQAVVDSATRALQQAGLSAASLGQLHAGLGLAGLNLPSNLQALSDWSHPFKSRVLANDLYVACLGAHQGQDGAVIICGTGFNAGAVIGGNYFEVGGHGFELGDSGSGARLGAEALRRTLEALDGIRDSTPMIEQVLTETRCTNQAHLVEKYIHAAPADYARFAPLVLDFAHQQDPVAVSIVKVAAAYIDRIAQRLMQERPPRLSMIGGISQAIQPWLSEQVQGWLSEPLAAPEVGAVFFARESIN